MIIYGENKDEDDKMLNEPLSNQFSPGNLVDLKGKQIVFSKLELRNPLFLFNRNIDVYKVVNFICYQQKKVFHLIGESESELYDIAIFAA